MSSSNYIKISQLDKLTVDDLKTFTGQFKLPIIKTDGKTIDLISSEIGKTIVSSGLGNDSLIDIYFKPNENITFSFNDLGLYWSNNTTFVASYAFITVNDSPSETYELSLIESDDPGFKLMTCDWRLEDSQYKKIVNKVSICRARIVENSSISDEPFMRPIGFGDKMSPSTSFLSNIDLIILNRGINQVIIDNDIVTDTNFITKNNIKFDIITPIGNLPTRYVANQVNFTNNFNSKTYFEGERIRTVLDNKTTKINNGKFINSSVQPEILNNIFENYEILDSGHTTTD